MAGWGYCRYCRARIYWGTNPDGSGRPFPYDDEDQTEVHFETCNARMHARSDDGVSHTVSQCHHCGEGVWWGTMPSGAKRPMNVKDQVATWDCHFDTCTAREEETVWSEPRTSRAKSRTRRDVPQYIDTYSINLWLPDLELTWPCTVTDVTSAFRRLAMIHHPDMGGNASAFIRIKLAYDRLKELLPQETAA